MKQGLWLGIVIGGLFGTGCQEPRPAAPEPCRPSLSIEPAAATVTAGHPLSFASAFTAKASEGVVWKVLEPGGGYVDGAGHYRAPYLSGTYTVQASLRSGSPTAQAKVTVVAPPAGNIAAPAQVNPGATALKAQVPAVKDSRYAWRLEGGKALAGAGSPTLTFEAGGGPLVILVCKVTNAAGDSVNSVLEIPVARPVSLTLIPASAILTAGRGMKFGFEISGGATSEVLWRVNTPGGGSVDGTGKYTAPDAPGLFEVQAASKDDPLKVAKAQVKVVAEPGGTLVAAPGPKAGATGLQARVDARPGLRYAWEIAGGTLLAGAEGPVLTFSAGTGPRLTLRCRIRNEAGDSLLLSRELQVHPSAPLREAPAPIHF